MSTLVNYPHDGYPHPRVTRITQTDATDYLIPWDGIADMVTGPSPNQMNPGSHHDEVRDALIEAFTRLTIGDTLYDELQVEMDAKRHAARTT